MRFFQIVLTIFLVSLLLCLPYCGVRASEIDELDPLADYEVHALPNVSTKVELDFDKKSVLETKLKSDQNILNNKIDQDKEVGKISVENRSTKSTQPNSESSTIEDSSLILSDSDIPDFWHDSRELSSDGCNGEHNSDKAYSVGSAARLVTSMLKVGPNHSFSQFRCDDPQDVYLPTKAREIYKKSVTWMPQKSVKNQTITNDYLQCVAFIFMSYAMADKPITKQGRTNAADFLAAKYTGSNGQFNKFPSGKTRELPQEGDVVVWSQKATGTEYGHVAIVLEVRTDSLATESKKNLDADGQPKKRFGTILVANSNASKAIYEYQYIVDIKTGLITLGKLADNWAKVPDYWLRMKE